MKLIETILKTMRHYISIGMEWTIRNTKTIVVSLSTFWLLLQVYRLGVGQECATLFEILMFGMILNLYIEHKSK